MKRIYTLLLVLAVIVLLPTTSHARSHQFTELIIDAWVLEDGTLRVEEQRTVDFQGTFSGMFQWIDTTRGISVSDISLREGERFYSRSNRLEPGPPSTFFVKAKTDSVLIDWSFEATNQQRTFVLSYLLSGAINVHEDVAELYIQFVGDEWEQPTENVTVTLHLPSGASKKEILAWGRGALHGDVEIVDSTKVVWSISPLPAKTMLEGRVTFPPGLVSKADSSAYTNEQALPGILAEEDSWAKQANRQRLGARMDWIVALLIVLVSLAASIWAWLRWGREYPREFQGEYYRDLPGNYGPAEMSVLYTNGNVSSRDLTATLLDLAHRKVIRIEEITLERQRLLRKSTETDYMVYQAEQSGDELRDYEQKLLDFLFTTVAETESEGVSFKQLERFAKKRKTAVARFWQQWQKAVKQHTKEYDFFDTTVRSKRLWVALGGGLLLLLGIPWLAFQRIIPGLAFMLAGIILLIGGLVLHRRSRKGNEDFGKWRSFRRFLEHFSEMQRHEIPSLAIWEHYLVYAVSLGVAKKVLSQLQVVYPTLEDGGYRFGYGWYYYSAANNQGLASSLSSFTTAMDSSIARSISAATSSSSSGSGAGGGFSSGGGGGVGGGGGGVR